MSTETLETIKKHISDTLGVKLVRANDGRDGYGFNAKIGGNVIHIFISSPFILSVEGSDDIARNLEELNILAFTKSNPGCSFAINSTGVAVEPVNG